MGGKNAAMDFRHTEEDELYGATLRDYALKTLLPDYPRWRTEPYPKERVRELAELGLMGLRIPEEYGGSGAGLVTLGVASEELARGDFNVTYYSQLTAIAARLLSKADEEIRAEWLPALAAGERMVAFGLTEPGAGSDAANISTRGRFDGGDILITGEKASITFGGTADACVVFARTGGPGARGISMVLVPLDAPGVTRQKYDSVGSQLTERGSLFFDDVRVPARNQIGEEGTGFVEAMEAFDYNRAVIALTCIGAAQQSLDETVEYAKERQTFGKPLARHEGVAFQISEHLSLLHAARLVAYQALWLADRGEPHTVQAAMCKWMGPKFSADALHACMILHGWSGYGHELPHAQRLADVIGLEIGDGTPEIMKAIIARETFGREFAPYK